jgi:sterol desaturase/sphingolipid hydroxylase (fatty acid hydroxylase superfamily)
MTDGVTRLMEALTYPLTRLVSVDNALGVPWLMGGAGFILASILLVRRRSRRALPPIRVLVRFLFPGRVWWAPSSRLDYKLFVINSVLVIGVIDLLIVGPEVWRHGVKGILTAALGGHPAVAAGPQPWIIALCGLASLAALDAGYWLAHLAMHRIPVLWAFHKVHHSAEVMTPATEWRQHPVEFLVFPTVYGATSGTVYGLAAWAFGDAAQGQALSVQTLLMALHLATFHHVRHSHVPIAFTGLWGKILHSPAHHHLHHSSDPAHHDRNLGYLLSVWDWMAGTLVLPTGRDRLTLGLGPDEPGHATVVGAYLAPVAEATGQMAAAARRLGAQATPWALKKARSRAQATGPASGL